MSEKFDHETYLSPFTWRYGTAEMRAVWSEMNKRRLWRRIWVALADAQHKAGLVSAEQVDDLKAHADHIDIERAHQIEAETRHDLMAEVRTFAEQCAVGGGIIHLGATSMDVEDNADALRLRQALDLVLERFIPLLELFADQIERWADTPTMGWTHIQPAEPSTVGYRLAQYGQDLLMDWAELWRARDGIRGKGFRGAIGTSASYTQLLTGTDMTPAEMEARILEQLDLEPFTVVTQTYPRKQDWLVLNALAGLGGSLYKFALDLRLLQAPPFGEWGEPFGSKQVGSSAMPFKRNPVNSENMNSLARYLAYLPRVAWDNAAHSMLERTIDDSGNRRVILPQAFLVVDELLRRAKRLISQLRVNEAAVARNLAIYGTFAATERVMMESVRAGADRQVMHEVIRQHSLQAWAQVAEGQPNPLVEQLAAESAVLEYLTAEQIVELMDAAAYVGDAPQRARQMAELIRAEL